MPQEPDTRSLTSLYLIRALGERKSLGVVVILHFRHHQASIEEFIASLIASTLTPVLAVQKQPRIQKGVLIVITVGCIRLNHAPIPQECGYFLKHLGEVGPALT